MELTTLGILFGYAVETSKGVKPESFTAIKGAVSLPAFPSSPEALDSTPLDATNENGGRHQVSGLAEAPGNMQITFNDTNDFQTQWEAMRSAYTSLSDGKDMWFEYYIPGKTDAFYYTGEPAPLGFGGAEVNNVLQNTGTIVPHVVKGWDDAVVPA